MHVYIYIPKCIWLHARMHHAWSKVVLTWVVHAYPPADRRADRQTRCSLTFQLNNLSPPWGTCGKTTLRYFSSYNSASCESECEINETLARCACLAPHMPPPNEHGNHGNRILERNVAIHSWLRAVEVRGSKHFQRWLTLPRWKLSISSRENVNIWYQLFYNIISVPNGITKPATDKCTIYQCT